jgi:hypothetical protein
MFVWLLLLLSRPASAQSAPPESVDVSAGWSALAAGNVEAAASIADAAFVQYPNSLSVAALLVPVEIERGGAVGGLSAYERWLGAKSIDEPHLLRVVASGFLREAARSQVGIEARRLAYQALGEEGDVAFLPPLGDAARANDMFALQVLGKRGNDQAVRNLITIFQSTPGDRGRAIAALGATGSPLAVQPLIAELSNATSTNRIAAAAALGALKAPEAAAPLRTMLMATGPFAERFAAASALFRLRDGAGSAFLRNLQASDSPMIRAQVLEAESSDPPADWQNAVRSLLGSSEAPVRLIAARLIAPYDSAAATATAQGMLDDANVADAEAARTVYAAFIATDFGSLRQLLHNGDALTRVNAAARVLQLTR